MARERLLLAFERILPEGGGHSTILPKDLRARLALLALLLAAAALRLFVALSLPNVHHADEIFQVAEQAHRLAYGYGVVPWEFQVGARSWLFPGALAVVMRAGEFVFGSPGGHLLSATFFLVLISLVPVWVAFLWGYRLGGLPAAIVGGGVCATWFEAVYFSSRASAEAVSASALLLGLYLVYPLPISSSRLRIVVGGCLLGLSMVLRIHLAPAIALAFALGLISLRGSSWKSYCAGFVAPVALSGLLDALTWSYPFSSTVAYLRSNLAGGARQFGVAPPHFYLREITLVWSGAAVPMGVLAWRAGRRLPLVPAMAVAIVIAHSFIGHKEYRFVFPAHLLVIVLAAIGSGELLRLRPSPSSVVLVLAGWSVTSAVLGVSHHYRPYWTRSQPQIRAFRLLARTRDVCGVGLAGIPWYATPGYVALHRDVPIYQVPKEASLPGLSKGFNYLLRGASATEPGDSFALHRRFGQDVALYKRPGGCHEEASPARIMAPAGPPSVERILIQLGFPRSGVRQTQ